MPVNEDEPIPDPPAYQQIFRRTTASIGASDRIPLRVLILFIITIGCTTLAPIPANIIGVAAVVLLALDTALHRR
jgi:hypothetical protein